MNGYEFADKLARVLGQTPIDSGDANQILESVHRVSRVSERKAVPLVSYLLGLADVSPTSFGQYVDMVANQAEQDVQSGGEPWTGYQFAEETATVLGRSQLQMSEADQILDNLQQAVMVSERLAVPLVCYLCGRAKCSPGEVGSRISEAVNANA